MARSSTGVGKRSRSILTYWGPRHPDYKYGGGRAQLVKQLEVFRSAILYISKTLFFQRAKYVYTDNFSAGDTLRQTRRDWKTSCGAVGP